MVILIESLICLYIVIYSYFNVPMDSYGVVAMLLLGVIIGIHYKLKNKNISLILIIIFIILSKQLNEVFALFGLVLLLESMINKKYIFAGISFGIIFIFNPVLTAPLLVLVAILGYVLEDKKKQEKKYRELIDAERRHRYELESAKVKLLKANENIISVTELNERNRIARSIHDNLGHKLVGISMILEASQTIRNSDEKKADELTLKVVSELQESVDLLRDTVHDLKPKTKVGIEKLREIAKCFTYCDVKFLVSGDGNLVSSGILAILSTNLMESLTNISKYSNASEVSVHLECKNKYIRFFVSDNGKSSDLINEGLGLSGMRERIENIGGTFTFNKKNGFEVCSFIPLDDRSIV